MALRRSKITRKGQVTIPIEFRKQMELEEGDTVLFEMDERGLHIVRPEDIVTRNAGIFREAAINAEPFDRERIWDEIVEERLGRPSDES